MNETDTYSKIFLNLPLNCQTLVLNNLSRLSKVNFQNQNINNLMVEFKNAGIDLVTFYNEVKKCIQDINNLSCDQLKELGKLLPIDFLEPALVELKSSQDMEYVNLLKIKLNCAIDGYNSVNKDKQIQKLDVIPEKTKKQENKDKNRYAIILLCLIILILLIALMMKN